jgi:hypothetical protein
MAQERVWDEKRGLRKTVEVAEKPAEKKVTKKTTKKKASKK